MTSAGPTDPTRTGDDAVARPEPAAVAAASARVAPEPEYGFPRALWRGLARIPVPPPADPRTWRSPLRGTWLTSVFASVLLVGLPIVILTGLMSYIAYGPQFGQAIPGDVGYLHLPFFDWPSNPSWFYRLTQGLHVTLGMVLTPVVLAKLWSVVPKLFVWPPVRSARPAARAHLPARPRRRRPLRVRHRPDELAVRLLVGLRVLHRPLLRGLGLHRRLRDPRGDQAPDDAAGAPRRTGRHRRPRALAARLARRDRARTDRPHRAGGARPEPAHALATRADRDGRRREPAGGGPLHRADLGPAAAAGAALAARAVLRERPRRLPDQPHARRLRDRPGGARRRVAAPAHRRVECGVAEPPRAARHAAAHRDAADRVRRGVVGDPDLDRRPAARPRRARGRPRAGRRVRAVDRDLGRLRPRDAADEPGPEPGRAAGAGGRQRGRGDRRPVPGPRLPRADHRPGAARGPQHQVGLVDRLPGAPDAACLADASTARTRCTCSPWWAASPWSGTWSRSSGPTRASSPWRSGSSGP